MIRWLASLAVRGPVGANLAMIALIVSGFVVYREMPREVFPDFSLDAVEVFSVYPGASPVDVERLVTAPIEDAIRSGGLAAIKTARIQAILNSLKAERGKCCLEFLRSETDEEVKRIRSLTGAPSDGQGLKQAVDEGFLVQAGREYRRAHDRQLVHLVRQSYGPQGQEVQ